MIALPRLYAIADATFGNPVEISRALFEADVRLIQIRDKKASASSLLSSVEQVMRLAPKDANVLVNDRVDVALLAGASGIHLGQDDLPIVEARAILGPRAIIGYSTHSLAQALKADQLSIDYLAVGPIFPTSTKDKPEPAVGLNDLKHICAAIRKPVVAIGGITLDRAPAVFSTGASSVAVIRDLLAYKDITERVRQWQNVVKAPLE